MSTLFNAWTMTGAGLGLFFGICNASLAAGATPRKTSAVFFGPIVLGAAFGLASEALYDKFVAGPPVSEAAIKCLQTENIRTGATTFIQYADGTSSCTITSGPK